MLVKWIMTLLVLMLSTWAANYIAEENHCFKTSDFFKLLLLIEGVSFVTSVILVIWTT